MEDLALVVALMVLGTLISGPLALGLSFVKIQWVKMVAGLLTLPGLFLGVKFIESSTAIGSQVIGFFGIGISVLAILNLIKRWNA